MANLLCEICGGRLIAKSGGVYECVSCGMQYDKERIREMVNLTQAEAPAAGPAPDAPVQAAPAAPAKPKSKLPIILAAAACAVILLVVLLAPVFSQMADYNAALKLMKAGKYQDAIAAFQELDGYRDSDAKIEECNQAMLDAVYLDQYNAAQALADAGAYAQAGMVFYDIKEYKDAYRKSFDAWYQAVPHSVYTCDRAGIMADGTIRVAESKDGDVEGAFDLGSWTDIISISGNGTIWGMDHTIGLRSDGTVLAAGNNEFGQCSVSGWRDIVAISTGSIHSVGLKADGTVVAAGGEDSTGQYRVDNWTNIVAIAAGGFHTVGLKADGTVVAVGDNEYGQCNVDTWNDIVAIAASEWHTVGLRRDGTVVATGETEYGRCDVSRWTNVVAITASEWTTTGLRADGTVVNTRNGSAGWASIPGWRDVVYITSDGYGDYLLAMTSDGTPLYDSFLATSPEETKMESWKGLRLP